MPNWLIARLRCREEAYVDRARFSERVAWDEFLSSGPRDQGPQDVQRDRRLDEADGSVGKRGVETAWMR